jgi:ATP-dependent Clp protease ATP-binding subunit ClpC
VAVPEPAPQPQPRRSSSPSGDGSKAPWWELSDKEYPWLASLGRNLTALAAAGKIDPVIGREHEIDEIIDILGKRRTNNPCSLGEPGVGKTAVVEGSARKLLELAERGLSDRVIVELDMATVVAGTQLRGSFSEKLNGIKEEVRRAGGRVVVFIDEIHTLIGAGSPRGPPGRRQRAQERARPRRLPLHRRHHPRRVPQVHQPGPGAGAPLHAGGGARAHRRRTEQILAGIVARYEEHHRVRYEPQALKAAAALAAKYVSDRFLPDKAISIIDLAGSRARREGAEVVDPGRSRASSRGWRACPGAAAPVRHRPPAQVEAEIGAKVIGHLDPVSRVARVVRRNYAGFASRRPMGTFLFMGPTGVGKTELARVLADVLFGGRDALVRVDMSECSESHGVARLVGAPPATRLRRRRQLTEPVRRRPSSVVLLDEIEKAHRDVLMLLLQVLEEGRLTDGKGRHIDFSNTVVILTTNLGAEAFAKSGGPLGFGAASGVGGGAGAGAAADERALSSVRKQLPLELWNRLDEKLVFRPLQKAEVSQVAALLLRDSSGRLASEKGIGYEAGAEVIEHLLAHGGFDAALGARPMRQAVQRLVEAPLADAILEKRFAPGDTVRIKVEGGRWRSRGPEGGPEGLGPATSPDRQSPRSR